MTAPAYNNGRYHDEDGNIIDKSEVRGRYLGQHCGNSLCDCRPASMWDEWNGRFVCAACASEINVLSGYARCVEPPKSQA
jgi:hypothetical protein